MILATFQPLGFEKNEYIEHKHTTKLKEQLGIAPKERIFWCFPANNVKQACVRACNVNPNYPEQLVIFETDKYYAIDGVKQDLTTIIDEHSDEYLKCNPLNIDYPEYTEFLVTNIPNKRFSIPISPAKASFEKMLIANKKMAKAYAIIESLKHIPLLSITTDDPSNVNEHQLFLIKNLINFVLHALPEVYECAVDYLELDIPKIQRKIMAPDDISRIFAIKSSIVMANNLEDLKRRYDMLAKVSYDSYFKYENVYPNDECPCGSKKKYKKCCGSSNALRTALFDGIDL